LIRLGLGSSGQDRVPDGKLHHLNDADRADGVVDLEGERFRVHAVQHGDQLRVFFQVGLHVFDGDGVDLPGDAPVLAQGAQKTIECHGVLLVQNGDFAIFV